MMLKARGLVHLDGGRLGGRNHRAIRSVHESQTGACYTPTNLQVGGKPC